MARFPFFFGAWLAFSAFTMCQTTTTTTATSATLNETIPTPVTGRPSFEIDVVFPRANTTYNYTDYLPVVFALQHMNATLALGHSRFVWAIMPYGREEDWRPRGLYVEGDSPDWFEVSNFVNPDGSPYYLVNSTNTTNWRPNAAPERPEQKYLYSLQWYLQWSVFSNETCGDMQGNLRGNIFFTLNQTPSPGSHWPAGNISYPNPQELGNVAGNCAQFGSMGEINVESTDTCEKAREVSSKDNCAVKPDAAMVSSMSSVAALRARPTPTETEIEEPSSSSAARATSMPGRSALVFAGIIGGLAFPI
ncbi:hypothetical protein P171DRAFT_429826 [Karstenula rhodostoma CBS 690.94]|uniref:DUF7136 domain-containing protein n=1 Tax=Karstenula rhodostoma CBS 690.94 TaxID=1392251 RepID=A0A9P4PMQ8_9PLEO|nr:hypothetical protein P171DRAFT_429826 [Karstenula rhodostoma CBS 690.94]